MARRQFKTAFAATGDKVSIPDAVQPDGSVSLQEGYGFDYQRDPQSDPLAKVFPRDVQNGILNEITASLGEIQQQGYAIWTVAGAPYMINAVVRHSDQNWQSNIANNSDEPGVGAGLTSWKPAGASVEKFNTAVTTIASAATINLTTGAADTSQLLITGTASITGFTVANGRSFIVRFAAACTLVNSASLVTHSGANILTAAGDSCLIRSTAANTVEILLYTTGIPQALGYRQTIQVLTPSRAINTNYTNGTGRPIFVMASINSASGNQPLVIVDGISVGSWSNNGTGANINFIAFVVPSGSTYRIGGGSGVGTWSELR